MVRTLLALAAAALTWPGRAAAPVELPGTYRLQADGRVEPRPFPPREGALRADAVIRPGEAADEVLVELAGEGLRCALTARVDAAGVLALARGQRCASDLRTPDVDGHLEALLVSGSGRLRGEELELEVAFTLSGAVRLKRRGLLQALATRFSLPGLGGEPVPVQGEGRARAVGRRDRSRAAVP